MNYRCKFCGYRFKSKDEQICPECLTAREEDISCGVYGEHDHSHAVFDGSSMDHGLFSKNDTFRDGRADFLKEEHRVEDRTIASRYEHRNGGDISMEADKRRRTVPTQQNAPYRPTPNAPYGQQQNNPPRQSGGKGCGCLFVFILILVAAYVITNMDFLKDAYEKINEAVSENNQQTQTEKKSKTEGSAIELPAECDFEAYLSESEKSEGRSDDERLNIYMKNSLFFVENDEYIPSTESVAKDLYAVDLVIDLKYPDGKRVESTDLDITDIECDAYDKDNKIISVYYGQVSDVILYNMGDISNLRPKLYYDKNADSVVVYVDAVYKGQDITFTVEI